MERRPVREKVAAEHRDYAGVELEHRDTSVTNVPSATLESLEPTYIGVAPDGNRPPSTSRPSIEDIAKIATVASNSANTVKIAVGAIIVVLGWTAGTAVWASQRPSKDDVARIAAGQQQQINDLAKSLAANEVAHQAILRELSQVREDGKETRSEVHQIYEGGKSAGIWGTPTAPNPPAVATRGRP